VSSSTAKLSRTCSHLRDRSSKMTSKCSSISTPLRPQPCTSSYGSFHPNRSSSTIGSASSASSGSLGSHTSSRNGSPSPTSMGLTRDHQKGPFTLPSDLAIFDPRPRATLLDDLEFISGKKLTFPFIAKFVKGKGEEKSQKTEQRSTLKKPQSPQWEQDFAWEGVRLLEEKTGGKDVTRGKWI